MHTLNFFVFLLLPMSLAAAPVVIAHRGASGYLPEHTLESASYAHALGADFIEQDVVLSKDDQLVVIHDIHLETTTNVAARFPERKREDGRFYVIDFSWAELATLKVRERVDARTDRPVFFTRFPAGSGSFRLCRLEEQIELIRGLNHSTGRNTGLYVEFKDPAFHLAAGKDISAVMLAALAKFGYANADDPVFVQCFDAAALERVRTQLKSKLRLIQLLEGDPHVQCSPAALAAIARYANGIGPPLGWVLATDATGGLQATSLIDDAHRHGLLVHPYTLRQDVRLPGFPGLDLVLDRLIRSKVDGFFIDQPDLGVRALPNTP